MAKDKLLALEMDFRNTALRTGSKVVLVLQNIFNFSLGRTRFHYD